MSVRQAAGLKLLAQAQRESQRDVLFRQLVAEGCATFIAAMAGVHNHEILHGSRSNRRSRSGRDLWSGTACRSRNCRLGGRGRHMRCGLRRWGNRDGATVVAEAGE